MKATHKSIALWPDEVSTGKIPNESEDTHHSEEAAWAVCNGLMERGLGGYGRIFPITVRVEPITDAPSPAKERT